MLDEPTVGLDQRPGPMSGISSGLAGGPRHDGPHDEARHGQADLYCDRIALMHRGTIRASGISAELKATLGDGRPWTMCSAPTPGDTLDDESDQGGIRAVRRARRTTRRLG
jgi:ABC-2 type transport system ATP-binding protein